MSRGDDKALGDIWQEIVYVKDTAELIAEGFLVRPVGVRVRVDDLQLGKVRKVAGDYSIERTRRCDRGQHGAEEDRRGASRART
jgi:superfamily II DNA or RNA helicase